MRAASAALLVAAIVPVAAAGAQQTRSQQFFRAELLGDAKTSAAVKDLLRTGRGFVDRSVAFRDLTGDRKTDAVVRVQSGGSAGAVALYVFSTAAGGELRPLYRHQRLTRGATRVSDGVLSFTTAVYAPGEPVCCPAQLEETTLRWDRRTRRFTIAERKRIPGPGAAPAPTPTPAPAPAP